MPQSKLWCALSVIGDLSVVIAIGICSILIRQIGTPYHRGFFKDDESLMYPHKSSTVHHNVLYGVGFSLPAVTLLLASLSYTLFMKTHHKWFYFGNEGVNATTILLTEAVWVWMVQRKTKTGRTHYTVWLWNAYKVCLMFAYGVVVTHFSTNVPKYTIGRLRPHFFSVCKPDMNALNNQTYLQGDLCKGSDTDLITEARVSFPSGHSSMAAYCMLFLVIYLQKRFIWHGMLLLKSFLQVACLLMAFFTCLSRVSDYKHHWSDVLAGGILGVLVALFVFWSIGTQCMPSQLKRSNSVDHGVPDQGTTGTFHTGEIANEPLDSTGF